VDAVVPPACDRVACACAVTTHGPRSASEVSSLPALVDRVINHGLVSEHHEHEVRSICADIFRLGVALGRKEALKEQGERLAVAQQQVLELNQEIEDIRRMDGER